MADTSAGSLVFNLTDNKNVEKFINSLKKVQKELVKTEGAGNKLTNNFSNFTKQIGNSARELRNSAVMITGAFSASVYGMERFLSSTANLTNKLSSLQDTTGISAVELQKFAKAGEIAGVSSEQVFGQISSLQKQLTDIKLGKGDALNFMRLGIDPYKTKSAMDAVKQIYKVVQNVPAHARGGILGTMGLDESFLRTMRQANQSMTQFNKIALSAKEISQVNKMGESIRKLKVGFLDLKNKAVAKLAPKMEEIFDRGFGWLLKNSDQIIGAISSIANWVGKFAEAVARALMFIGQLFNSKNALKGIAMAVLAIATSFAPVTAAVVGLLLLLDDIAVWKAGGESLFGDFYSAIDKFIQKIKSIGEGNILANLYNVFKNFAIDIGKAFIGLVDKIGIVKTSLLGIGTVLTAIGGAKFLGLTKGLSVISSLLTSIASVGFLAIFSGLKLITSGLLMIAKAALLLLANPVFLAIATGTLAVAGVADLAIRGKESVPAKAWEASKDYIGNLFKNNSTPPAIQNPNLAPVVSNSTSSNKTSNNNITINVNSTDEATRLVNEIDSQREYDTIYNGFLLFK